MSHRTPYGTVSSRYSDDPYRPVQRYYPGTYIDDHPQYQDERHEGRGYREYAGRDYRREGFDYVTTTEPFKPEPDYYQKEYKRPYVYRDNRLYHHKDPVRKYYDGAGNVTVTVIEGGDQNSQSQDYTRYATSSTRGDPRGSVRSQKFYPPEESQQQKQQQIVERKQEVEVGYLVEHLASFDIGDDHDANHAGENIEAAIETLRNMDNDNAILPLRCYLTHKDQEIQVLSDKELNVLEWIKLDDINLVSAEVHQLTRYEQILLVQVKEVIHLFCPCGGDLSAEDLAKIIKERIARRRDCLDERGSTHWEEDTSNDRYVLNDQNLKGEVDVDFYDKYTMQLYGRATRDYVARNDKELTVMSGERVEIQSTRGQWWLAQTSSGKSGYVPAECLESYVPSPAGLPRTAIPEQRARAREDASERASVYSAASSRHRVSRETREYDRKDYDRRDYDRREHDRRDYDRRDYDRRDDRRDYRDDRRGNNDNSFENRARSLFGPQRGLGSGLNAGTGFGATTGFGSGLNAGTGFGATTGFGTATGFGATTGLGTTGFGNTASFGNTLGTTGLGTGLGTTGLSTTGLGNGLGTVGPSAFSTISSATGAGLFPNGFTQQLQGTVRGVPLAGATPGILGAPTLGAAGLGAPTLGASGLGVGVPQLGGPRVIGMRPLGTINRTVPMGGTVLGGAQLGGLGGAQLGGLGGAQLGGLGGAQLGGLGGAQLGGLGGAQLGGLGGAQLGGLGGAQLGGLGGANTGFRIG